MLPADIYTGIPCNSAWANCRDNSITPLHPRHDYRYNFPSRINAPSRLNPVRSKRRKKNIDFESNPTDRQDHPLPISRCDNATVRMENNPRHHHTDHNLPEPYPIAVHLNRAPTVPAVWVWMHFLLTSCALPTMNSCLLLFWVHAIHLTC